MRGDGKREAIPERGKAHRPESMWAIFDQQTAIEHIEIPEGVISIKDKAFEGNDIIKRVKFPDSLLKIGFSAFSGCISITDIELNEGGQPIYYYIISVE